MNNGAVITCNSKLCGKVVNKSTHQSKPLHMTVLFQITSAGCLGLNIINKEPMTRKQPHLICCSSMMQEACHSSVVFFSAEISNENIL
jgi:hypothetical protein